MRMITSLPIHGPIKLMPAINKIAFGYKPFSFFSPKNAGLNFSLATAPSNLLLPIIKPLMPPVTAEKSAASINTKPTVPVFSVTEDATAHSSLSASSGP